MQFVEKVCVFCVSVCACVSIDALISAVPVVCNRVCTLRRACLWARTVHRHMGGRKWCMISPVPILQVSSLPLKHGARTVVRAWGGIHAWQSCRRGARPACTALPVHTHPSCPLGTCVHRRVRHAGWACRRCTRVRWMYSTPSGWIISGVLSGAPCTGFAGVCGAGWSSGHSLAAPTPASLRSMRATVHPFIFSNINIFAFPPQPKRDKALRGGSPFLLF